MGLIQRFKNYQKSLENFNIHLKIERFNRECKETEALTDFSRHVIVSGEPRGGTTWMMELLMDNHQAIVWEPLHQNGLKKLYGDDFAEDIGFMPYIPENEEWEEAEQFFSELFSGYLPIGLRRTFTYDKSLKNVDRLLIKFCRANMILPWLTKKFPNIRPIYIVRHPLAVIASQYKMKAFEGMGESTNIFDAQESRYSALFDKHADKINAINSKEAMFANWWAISNVIPLTHPRNNKSWLTVSYEKLFLDPVGELKRIENYIEAPLPEGVITRVKKASISTQPGSGILSNGSQLGTWKNLLTQQQIDTILSIVKSYGITAFSESEEPDYAQLGYR